MAPLTWRKSSHSGGENSQCVELNLGLANPTGRVRDSKNTDGPELSGDVRRLVAEVKAGWLGR